MNSKSNAPNKTAIIVISILIVLVLIAIVAILLLGRNASLSEQKLIDAVASAWAEAQVEDQPAYITKLDELSSYEIISITDDEDRYVIEVMVTAPDLAADLLQLDFSEFPQTKDTAEVDAFLCEKAEKAEIKQTVTEIYVLPEGEGYHVIFSDEFADAMSGKLYSYSKTVMTEILQQYKEGEAK